MTTAALRAAVDQLAAGLEAMGAFTRIKFASTTLAAGRHGSGHPPQARAFWLAVSDLAGGVTEERTAHLVSVMEVVGPDVRQAIEVTADRAAVADPPRGHVWRALAELARTASTS
ncbi:MAG TPA: hypothetical protein VGP91_11845 [Actinoplanes sp.]|nr:hypothetical protein [Actinoplanes sp.]